MHPVMHALGRPAHQGSDITSHLLTVADKI